MYKSATYTENIVKRLSSLCVFVQGMNKVQLTDGSNFSEDFFSELLNEIFGLQLSNLNRIAKNYPSIDLGDLKNSVCVQITADNERKKIEETIEKFEEYKIFNDFKKLIIFIVGHKKRYQAPFKTELSLFDKDQIWDIETIFESIRGLDTVQLKKIDDFLDRELSDLFNINPLELSEEDIAQILNSIHSFLKENLSIFDIPQQIPVYISKKRDPIEGKNILNLCSRNLFEEIKIDIKYDDKLEKFLADPINKEYQGKYFVAVSAIQAHYLSNRDKLKGVEDLFAFLYREIATYENHNQVDPQKLLVVLHNMYFNCDIGEKSQ